MFTQDSRDKPENDWCWGRWFSICCKFFKYPSPGVITPTSPARGEVKNNILSKDLDVVRQYAAILERGVQNSTLAKKLPADGVQGGRSMIEMLGVLAIIAVLTAGGLVGFNKAMSAYHWNMALEQWDTLINVVLKYKSQLHINDTTTEIDTLSLLPILEATGDLPDSMPVQNCKISLRDCYVVDALGNKIRIYNHNTGYIGIGYWGRENSIDACRLILNIGKQYYDTNIVVQIYEGSKSQTFFGSKNCSGTANCLKDMSVSQINEICKNNQVCKDENICHFLLLWD